MTKIRSLPRARGLLFGRAAPTRRGLLFEFVLIAMSVFAVVVIGQLIWGGSWVSGVVSGVVIVLAAWSGRVYRYRHFRPKPS